MESSRVHQTIPLRPFIIKANLTIISVGFLLLFTSYQALQHLQSTLNRDESLGTTCIAVIYGCLIASSLFLPPVLINKLGCKWTLVLSMLCYLFFMAANFDPSWPIMIPASVILGLGAAPLWTAKSTYLSQTAIWLSQLTNRSTDDVNNLFFGIFFMFFQMSQIFGSIVSSVIFSQRPENVSEIVVDTSECGANFDPLRETNITNLARPDTNKVYLVCGIFLGFGVLAFLLMFFLSNIKDDRPDTKGCRPSLLLDTFRHCWNSRYQKLLIPLTIYSGFEQGFFSAEYTRSYVGCSIGMWNVGYILIAYGIADSIGCVTFGSLVKYVGHVPFFALAFFVHGGTQIFLLLWRPNSEHILVFYVISALWGTGDAVIQTQINALYGDLFQSNKAAAFSNYRFWESCGVFISFAYSGFLVTSIKLYVLLTFLVIGMALYVVVEVLKWKSLHRGHPV